MGDERRANPEYAEDVDVMILEYLIYNTTKSCIADFMVRNASQATVQPAQCVQIQLHILNDFLRIYKAKYRRKELGEEIRLWLELLELVVLISYRRSNSFPACSPEGAADPQGWQDASAKLFNRRQYWLLAREDASMITDREHDIYSAWKALSPKSGPQKKDKLPHHTLSLSYISALFFTISAKVASSIDQGISGQWVELGVESMLQAALEMCLMPEGIRDGENALAVAFAWGWIPSKYWDDYDSDDEAGVEDETTLNDVFEDAHGDEARENSLWQETRLRYLSLFNISRPKLSSDDDVRSTRLRKVATDYPIREFESKVVIFSQAIWDLCRKPLLVQIERGQVDGMTADGFEQFQRRIFAPR